MHEDFFKLKGELIASGGRFTPEILTRLSYGDMLRAGIGDAGRAACTLEEIQAETRRRFTPYLVQIKNLKDLQRLGPELKTAGMLEDLTRFLVLTQPLEDVPQWGAQGTRVRLFFLIKCLRAHGDEPRERLLTVQGLIEAIAAKNDPERNLLTILRYGVEDCLKTLEGKRELDPALLKLRFKGYQFLTRAMYPEDAELCQFGIVQGYRCSADCFTPSLPTED